MNGAVYSAIQVFWDMVPLLCDLVLSKSSLKANPDTFFNSTTSNQMQCKQAIFYLSALQYILRFFTIITAIVTFLS